MIETEQRAVRRREGSRVLRYTLAALGGTVILAWVALAIFVHRAQPYVRQRIVEELNRRFDGDTDLEALSVSVFPEMRVVGENVTFHGIRDSGLGPVIRVRRFSLTASPLGLLGKPITVGTLHLSGLSISLPPRKHGSNAPPPHPTTDGSPKTSFVVVRIVSDDAHLELLTDKPGKLPLEFDIATLTMDSAGPGRAMPFTATLTNPKPVGDITTQGEFGPWNTEQPRDTPVSGTYSFTNANLATINGIGGILRSKGSYKGELDHIDVQGQTDTPDFLVSTGSHPMNLHTDFSATVDGTSGDTYLHPVRATLANSLLIANGSVVRQPDGHRVTLNVSATNARIEDLLKVAVKTSPPTLSGPVALQTKFLLPPGMNIVAERLQLDGSFSLPAAHFLNAGAQEKLDKLSLRVQGRPKEAQQVEDAPDVLSEIAGSFKLGGGVVSIANLMFKIPGASIAVAGDYRLVGQEFSFEGQARLEAKLSQMTTGVKSFFLKAVDPFFAKQGAGSVLPIRISGTGTNPKIGLDFGHLKRGG